MDAEHFDRLVLTLTRARTRRSVLGLLAALGLTRLVARDVAAACLANGRRCLRTTDCCSGWCKRKRGTFKKFCRQAPEQGICTIESNSCTIGSPYCDVDRSGTCACFVTTRGFSFCGRGVIDCFACATNADCEQRTGEAGARCVPCSGACAHINERACIRKCPDPAIP